MANAARRPWIVALQMRASRVLIAAGAIGLALVAGVRVDSALGAQRARAELEAEFAAVEAPEPHFGLQRIVTRRLPNSFAADSSLPR